jgi:hypothetical protein
MTQTQKASKKRRKTVVDFNKRFVVIGVITTIFGVCYATYLYLIEDLISPPITLRVTVPQIIILCFIGGSVSWDGEDDKQKKADESAGVPWRDWFLVTVTVLFIVFFILPNLALGGPIFSGFAHPLMGFASIILIATGSNWIRMPISAICIIALIATLPSVASRWLPFWPTGYTPVKDQMAIYELISEWGTFSFVLLTFLATVWLTFDRKNKQSLFDKISTVDESTIESLAMGLNEQSKKKLIDKLTGSLEGIFSGSLEGVAEVIPIYDSAKSNPD